MRRIIYKCLISRKLKSKKKIFSDKINILYNYRLSEYNTLLSIIERSEDTDKEYLLRVWLLALYSNREWYFCEILDCYMDFISWFKIESYNNFLQSLYIARETSLKLNKKKKWKEFNIEEGILKIPNIFDLNVSETFFEIIKSNNIIKFSKKNIDTESNLNASVLKKNLHKIWINNSYIERIDKEIMDMKFKNQDKEKQGLLDDLLNERNDIAHWSKTKVKYQDLKNYHEKILILFNSIKEILQKSYNNCDFLNSKYK